MNTKMNSRLPAVIALLLGLCLTGCGSEDMPQVCGTVTLDGNPVADASVSFFPGKGRAATGKTDDEGYFTLAYLTSKSGIPEGDYKVTISTYTPSQMGRNEEYEAEVIPGTPESIPQKYTSRKTTELTKTVKKGDNEFNFALESELAEPVGNNE